MSGWLARLAAVAAAALALAAPAAAVGDLAVSPSSVQLGDSFTLSGCGYPVPTSISIEVSGPKKSGIHYFTAGEPIGADGCFSQSWTAWWSATGTYQITSWWRDGKGATRKGAVVKLLVTGP